MNLTDECFMPLVKLYSGQQKVLLIVVGTACACITIILTIVFYFSFLPSTSNHYHNSEDYYGDLDLKSIRKSELLAGLNSQGRSSPPAAAPNKPNKPRPQNNQNRPSPPPSQGEA